ncbi:agamous-like MADS-box protein AGL62 [Dioscorea cayenensis subsp. rotundata]|uniref:Agamous-like MADS-box protein AGL62 n=1 Tax=Dioscorea cayennensis subsp. rotundata TaxID=55577 RepID=A0AB40AHR9_DIOCR|nr:agamous-like MADS-box protein AGL62 [Dioscorea cayenensis subsp. rotundata]
MEMNSRAPPKKRGGGRRKIPIERIGNDVARQVCFSKRRRGLFKKAAELSILCGVDIAVVAFSPGGKPFTFGNPNLIDAAIDQLQHPTLDLFPPPPPLPPPPPSIPNLESFLDPSDELGQMFDERPEMMPTGPEETPWWATSVDPAEIGELVGRNATNEALRWDFISDTGEMEPMNARVLDGQWPLGFLDF